MLGLYGFWMRVVDFGEGGRKIKREEGEGGAGFGEGSERMKFLSEYSAKCSTHPYTYQRATNKSNFNKSFTLTPHLNT